MSRRLAQCNARAQLFAAAAVIAATLGLRLASAHAEGPELARDYDAIVVGAGPAGHSAVQEALRAGATRVLHLDDRSDRRTRPQMFFLDPASVLRLTEHQLDMLDRSKVTPMGRHTRIETVDGVDRVLDVMQNPPGRLAAAAAGRAPKGIIGMLLRRKMPVATIPINTLEEAQQEPERRDPRVTVVYGAEVIEVVQNRRRGATAVFTWNGKTHRAGATLVGLAVGSRAKLLARLGVRRKQVGKSVMPIRLALLDQPGHDIVGRKARVGDLRLPDDFPLDRREQIRILHMGWEGGEAGRTALLIELSPAANRMSEAHKSELTEAVKSFAGLTGETVSANQFESTMTRSDRVFVSKNVVVLGDGLQTTAPHVGLGMSVGVLQGRFFGRLYQDLATARSAGKRWLARARFAAAVRATRLGLHLYSKLFLRYYLPLDRKGQVVPRRTARPGKRPIARPRMIRRSAAAAR